MWTTLLERRINLQFANTFKEFFDENAASDSDSDLAKRYGSGSTTPTDTQEIEKVPGKCDLDTTGTTESQACIRISQALLLSLIRGIPVYII